jgi:hypothetical protein
VAAPAAAAATPSGVGDQRPRRVTFVYKGGEATVPGDVTVWPAAAARRLGAASTAGEVGAGGMDVEDL